MRTSVTGWDKEGGIVLGEVTKGGLHQAAKKLGDACVTPCPSIAERQLTHPMLKSYRDLEVWKRGLQLVAEVYRTTRRLPAEERFGLIAQMRRAAVSITSNIAEGYGRSTRGEYLNHLSFARGSLYELESLCEVCQELSLVSAKDLTTVSKNLMHVRRLLRRLIEALRKRTKPA